MALFETAREQLARELFRRERRARWTAESFARTVDSAAIWFLFAEMCKQRKVALPREPMLLGNPRPDSELLGNVFSALWKSNAHTFCPLPTEILGSVYESFLGRTITLTGSGPRFLSTAVLRKNAGVYYTPQYIVDYIVEETVGKVIVGKSPREMRRVRILDPACGAGRFLLRVYDRIVKEHLHWVEMHPHGPQGEISLLPKWKREILSNCIFGIDIDELAVEVTKLSLYLKVSEDQATSTSQQGSGTDVMETLAANIRYGDSLGKPGDDSELYAPRKFSHVFRSGGFDVVLGNPPYGAKLTPKVRSRLSKQFNAGTTETAALMMLNASRSLTRQQGLNGFIVPKAFTYSSNWNNVRSELTDEMTSLVDVGKVWPKVRLEQVIYFLHKGTPGENYTNLKRKGETFERVAVIDKAHCREFGFLPNGISREELEVGLKIQNAGSFLSEYVGNTRGAMFQGQVKGERQDCRVIGGKQIRRFHIAGEKGFISSKALDKNAFVAPGSILVQNIVAHIENPIDHIKIAAAIVDEGLASQIVILDTVNQLTNPSSFSSYFFLAILNSRLMNWYIYRFIYAKAIRTMHFDGPVTARVPVPRITPSHQHLYQEIVSEAKALSGSQSPDFSRTIEAALHRLYGLCAADVAVIESGMPRCKKQKVSAAAVRP